MNEWMDRAVKTPVTQYTYVTHKVHCPIKTGSADKWLLYIKNVRFVWNFTFRHTDNGANQQEKVILIEMSKTWQISRTFKIQGFPTKHSIGLSSVLRPRQHSIGYMGDGFYRSKDPTNSIKVLKEQAQWQAVSQASLCYSWCSKCSPCSWTHVRRRPVSSCE